MTLAPGTRVGAYEIVARLGAGGMGEVYRAKDTRLGRAAAIKTLPPEFAQDADRRLRFEREAKTLASLNHPHIAQVYGLEDIPGTNGAPPSLALVMELVEGEDLAARISRGPVALDDAWPLARQIAEGLEAAHEAGIVHRDLKPANIRVTPDGIVKVLDFGLAKPIEPVGVSAMATHAPTLTTPALTTGGVVLGTASYMAPEQAKGKPVDRRADIWAFGCVLYELLTAKRAFEGEDVSETLAAVLRSEPDWTRLPAATPARIRTLLQRCLAKDRTQRLQHIGDARLELDEAFREPALMSSHNGRGSRGGAWALAVGGVAAVGLGALLGAVITDAPVPATESRAIQFDLPIQGRFALSPDGRYLAYTEVGAKGGADVWLRDLSRASAEKLGESDLGNWLGWSPDGAALYVSATNGNRRFNMNTKASVLEPAPSPILSVPLGGKVVLHDGRIIVGGSRSSVKPNLHAWTPEGVTDLIPLDASVGESRQSFPAWLGQGHVSYASVRTDGSTFLCITTIEAPRPRCAGPLNQSSGVFFLDGRIAFARDRSVLVRGFDLASARFTSNEQSLADDYAQNFSRLAASDNGSMAIAVDAGGGDRLEWMSPGHQPVVVSEQPATTKTIGNISASRVFDAPRWTKRGWC